MENKKMTVGETTMVNTETSTMSNVQVKNNLSLLVVDNFFQADVATSWSKADVTLHVGCFYLDDIPFLVIRYTDEDGYIYDWKTIIINDDYALVDWLRQFRMVWDVVGYKEFGRMLKEANEEVYDYWNIETEIDVIIEEKMMEEE